MAAPSSFGAKAPEANGAYDIPDSTDWLNTPLASLMPVEAALRCHVCKDFYNSPMLTQCSHTFCSLCIRRCLTSDGKCPLCRMLNQESKLQGNWALREVVDAFVRARPALLEVARTPPTVAAAEPEQRTRERSRSRKRKADALESPDSSQGRRTRTSARLARNRISLDAAATLSQEEPEELAAVEAPLPPLSDGLVECPICQARMKEQAVDRHLDTSCPGSPPDPKQAQPNPVIDLTSAFPQAPTSRAKPIQPPPERLPSLSYSLLKDTALRKKMSELGLPTTGGRSLLELRHKEWIMLWNANCDSARPKKRSELLRDLDVWERTLGGRAQYGSFSGSSAAAQVKDKDFDGIAWASKHDDSFKALIANAKRSRSQAQKGSEEKEDSPGGSGDQQVNGVITGSLDKSSSQDAHNEVTDGVTTFPDARAAMIHGPDGGQSGEGDQVTRSSEPETPQFLTGDVIPSSSQLEVDMPLPQSSAVS